MNARDDRLVGDRESDVAALVGRRVALRHRIAADDAPGPRLTDAVGELADGGPGPDGDPTVRVRTRTGGGRVRVADVVAVRAVPPAPPRRASFTAVDRLERICARAWPAPLVRELGDWWLRAGADGWTRRAHSALAVGDPGMPTAAALDEVRRFADSHGIPPVVATPEGSPWWRAVRGEGWALMPDDGAESIVLVSGCGELAAAPGVGAPARPVVVDPEPDRAWSAVFGDLGDPGDLDDPGDPRSAARRAVIAPDGLPLGFGLARDHDGTVSGAVRAAVVDDHVYLSRLEVLPHARRRGVATALTAAAARWALDRGVRHAVLQVISTNTAARALYERMGCVEHHRYHYLAPPEA